MELLQSEQDYVVFWALLLKSEPGKPVPTGLSTLN